MSLEDIKAALEDNFAATKAFVKSEVGRQFDEIARAEGRRAAAGGVPDDDARAALVQFMRSGERTPGASKTMVIGANPDGGYAVPTQISEELTAVGAEQGAIRKLARVYAPDNGSFAIVMSPTLAGAGRVAETDARTNTATPALARVVPPNGGIYAVAPVSNWLLNDSKYDIARFVTESIGSQFGVTESADFVSGDGVGKALGFLTSPQAATADAARPFGTVEKLHAGSTSDFDVDDLISLLGKLAPRYRKAAAFVMHPDTATYVRKLKSATSGEYYWQAATAAGMPPTLLGIPALEDVNLPTISSGAGVVAVADWQRFYAIVDVGPVALLRDPYTSKGHTLFYVEKRTGGCVTDSNAGKILVMSA